MYISVNYLVVFVAAIASMVVGFIWYTVLFGKTWSGLMGYTKESMEQARKGMGKMYAINFLLALLMAYFLFHVSFLSAYYFHNIKLVTGLTSAFSMWLGFVMPVQATDALFGNKSFKLFLINTGYQLVSLLVMGLVLGLM